MTLSEQDVARLKAAAEQATQGEWFARDYDDSVWVTEGDDDYRIADTHDSPADARYIAIANPATILALLADRKALQSALQEGGDDNPWYRTARDMANNVEFWRGLVIKIGEMFGDEAKTADDGSLQDSVLALKVPELVQALRAQAEALKKPAQKHCASCVDAQCWGTRQPLELENEKLRAQVETMQAALRNIRLSAAAGRTFGHNSTPISTERMVQRKDERFDSVLKFCSDAGVTGSLLRSSQQGATPEALSVYRCRVCGTRWLFWGGKIEGLEPGLWNLLDQHQRPGACCDNAPMGEQMEFLRDIISRAALTPPQEQP